MAWRLPGDKPLSEPTMVSLLTHICITRPQRVNKRHVASLTWHIRKLANQPLHLHWNDILDTRWFISWSKWSHTMAHIKTIQCFITENQDSYHDANFAITYVLVLKTKGCHNANFVVNVDTQGCCYDVTGDDHWQQNWHCNNSSISVYLDWATYLDCI